MTARLGEEALRKKREEKKKKLGLRVIWVVGATVGAARSGLAKAWLARGVCSLSVSLSLCLYEGWKPFEGKIEIEIDFRLERGTLQSKLKLISVDPIFLCLPNIYRSVK